MICKKIMGLRYKTIWHVAIRKGEAGQILKDFDSVWHVLEAPKDHWCADPFLFVHLGEVYIFVEYYDLKLKKGAIGYTKYNPDTEKCGEWKEIIVEDFHLSFPFIYEEDDNIYILPACTSGNFVRYKAVSFPDMWEQEILVKNVEFADTAIYKVEDYYIGYTLQRHAFGKEDRVDRARLFTMKGTNIVLEDEFYSEDPRIRRLAGGVIEADGKCWRVAQNCESEYGKSLIFLEWDKEKKMDGNWKEIEAIDLKYDRRIKLDGIHTYNSCNGYEIIDIKSKYIDIKLWILRISKLLYDKAKKKLGK